MDDWLKNLDLKVWSDEARWPKAILPDPPVEYLKLPLGQDWDGQSPLFGIDPLIFQKILLHDGLWSDGIPYRSKDFRFQKGSLIRLYWFRSDPPPLDFEIPVLASGPHWMAVLKPSGLSVGRTRAASDRCLEYLIQQRFGEGWRAAHRLDRDTSGVLLLTEDRETTAEFFRAFRDRKVEKLYLALVSNPPKEDLFTVEGNLVRSRPQTADPSALTFELIPEGAPLPSDREARPSQTQFGVIARSQNRALLWAKPLTGRTHQIRVHLRSYGCPILGDPLYGGEPAERLMLHAYAIRLRGNLEIDVCSG